MAITPRELEVLRLIADEHLTTSIANMLNISVFTVNNHRKSLLRKSNARTMAGLMKWAIANGHVSL
jgi:DNA-binding CsgD family transcriptional regulator